MIIVLGELLYSCFVKQTIKAKLVAFKEELVQNHCPK